MFCRPVSSLHRFDNMFPVLVFTALFSFALCSVQCPDHKSSCPDGTTCCQMVSGQYGCCPMPKAVCCSDHQHCCPHGTTCDVKNGTCIETTGAKTRLHRKLPSIPDHEGVGTIQCSDHISSCPDGTTCCLMVSGEYGCCPMPSAVCCTDKIHCCPHDTQCDLEGGTCRKEKEDHVFGAVHSSASLIEYPLNMPKTVCGNRRTACLGHSTCCQTSDDNFGCCPFVDGVCCANGQNCCPKDTICARNGKECNFPHNTTTTLLVHSLTLYEGHSVGPSITKRMCLDGSECPAQSTCCNIGNGNYACCPIPNAVCCENSCCPNGYHCSFAGKCIKNAWHFFHGEKQDDIIDDLLF